MTTKIDCNFMKAVDTTAVSHQIHRYGAFVYPDRSHALWHVIFGDIYFSRLLASQAGRNTSPSSIAM